ncbi:hypothetical protein ABNB56_11385 [Streptococcus iniae]|uniref:hypothetical protein n=1 Tax=Streptococcus iniae TaxID=1346 RepID=UPI000EFC41C4|nr:hypothetical protein [Streptococcus iniae]RMI77641.1 hypothetical protein DIX58_04175 [Streptococcus iniae]
MKLYVVAVSDMRVGFIDFDIDFSIAGVFDSIEKAKKFSNSFYDDVKIVEINLNEEKCVDVFHKFR